MGTKDEYIQLIDQLVTQPAEVWQNDPFEQLLKQIPSNVAEKYVTAPEAVLPSTSDEHRTVNFDARLTYSKILGGVYLDLAAHLQEQRQTTSDEYHLVSLQDATVIKKSFQFFLLTGILPFLEPGVGLGAAARSTFIKSWKLYDGNAQTNSERLSFAARVILALLTSNDALTVQFLPKYIDDIYAVRYQLLELGVDEFEEGLKAAVERAPVDLQFASLMFLIQDKKPNDTPKWLKAACGRQMSMILVSKDGLHRLLQYYKERAGETWTDHLPMTKQVGWQLATVPKLFKNPREYHEIISDQFFETIWNQKVPDKNLLAVFCCYVEELRVRFSLNADITVFDKILRFWEILNRRIQEQKSPNSVQIAEFSPNHIRNLQLLSQILPSADPKRIRVIFPCLFACVEDIPHVKDILKGSIENIGNFGYSLYNYVMTPTQSIAFVKTSTTTSSMIQEIGENAKNNEEPKMELWFHGLGNVDEGVGRRMHMSFYIVDNVVGQQAQVRTILEMMSFALEDFLKTSEKERDDDAARFVTLDGAKLFSSHHAHLVVGCCFERITMYSMNAGFSPDECVQILRLAEQILNNASQKFNRLANRRRVVDVFVLSDQETKELQINRDTAKLCLPIISTVFFLTQGSPRFHDTHVKSLEAMANFVKASDTFPVDDVSFNSAVDESKKLLGQLNIDVNQCGAPPIPQRADRRKYSQHIDLATELIEELHDDEPAMKGAALMQIAKAFRLKNYMCGRLLEYGAMEMAKEMVVEDDSYVYLAAINCLCEMALFDRRLFDMLIDYYEELNGFEEKSDTIVIRVSRVAEAVGKIFLVKGDYSVAYFNRMAAIFLKGMDEPHELVRASSCGALGNLLNATRGRGIEKWIDQFLHKLHNMLRLEISVLVRRSAIDLIRQCLKACGTDMFVILRERLLDIHREVNRLKRSDRDETVRLHAELCCDEVNAALRQNQEDVERGYTRRIRF